MQVDINLLIDALRDQDKIIHAQIAAHFGAGWAKEKYATVHKAQNAIADALNGTSDSFSVKTFLLAIRQNRLTNGKHSKRPICRGCDGARVNVGMQCGKEHVVVCSECDGSGMAPTDWKEREDYE